MSELTSPSGALTRAARRGRTRFFLAIAGAILAIVLVGFAPTLYLRALFDVPAIPGLLYLHGTLLTAWFALVVTQAALVRAGNVALHRRLGVAGVALGVALVIVSTVVTLRFVDRVLHAPTAMDSDLSVALGFGAQAPLLGIAATALWGNLTSLTMFSVLVCCAVLARRRGDVHKRLMVLASVSILAPAIARISRWPGLGGDLGPLVPSVFLSLLFAMVGFDLFARRRVHWVTVVGGGFVVLGIVGSTLVATSPFGLRVLERVG